MAFDLTTFVIDSINFLVLMWLLQRLLYRPLKKGIEARKAETDRELERAREEAKRLAAQQAELALQRQALEALRDSTLRDAKEQAEEQRARLLEQARQDADTQRARAAVALAAERDKVAQWVRDMALERGIEVAGSMLVQLSGESLNDACLQRLSEQLEAAGPSLRSAAAGQDSPLRALLSTASGVGDHSLATLRGSLEMLLERPVRFEVHEDANLLAGAILEIGDQRFDASLAGQMKLVRQKACAELEKEVAVA